MPVLRRSYVCHFCGARWRASLGLGRWLYRRHIKCSCPEWA
jgi:hypothetical protein